MGHTPGPWIKNDFGCITDKRGYEIGKINNEGLTTEENEANVNLVISAPVMLEMLEKIRKHHEYVKKECIWHLEANAQVGLIRLLRDLDGVIANAYGKK